MINKRLRAYDTVKNGMRKSQLKSVEKVEGEPIEAKVRRMVKQGEKIVDGAPEIYTERKEGVVAGFNIRTDRWEVATDAMDKVSKSHIASRSDKGKVIDLESGEEKKDGDGGAKSIQGKS